MVQEQHQVEGEVEASSDEELVEGEEYECTPEELAEADEVLRRSTDLASLYRYRGFDQLLADIEAGIVE